MQIYMKLLLLGISFFTVWSNVKAQNERGVLLSFKTFTNNINNGAFIKVITDVAKDVVPFIKIFSSILNIIFGITSTESTEVQVLRNLSDTINRRFDQVDAKFEDVTRLMHWTTTQTIYSELEGKIHSVSEQFTRLFQVPQSAYLAQKYLFIHSYETDYLDSGNKLFAAFMHDNGVISEGLIRPAMNYTENDRSKLRTFMLGILKLLLISAKLEIGYMSLKGFNNVIPFYSHLWNDRFERVRNKMQKVDLELEGAYNTQSLKDIDRFTLDNVNLDYKTFSRRLYDKLSKKYFWRDWLVIINSHTRIYSHSKVCSGVVKTAYGKDIVIDSVEKERPPLNLQIVLSLYSSLIKTCENRAYYDYCDEYNNLNETCQGDRINSRPCRRYRRCGGLRNYDDADKIFSWFDANAVSCSLFSSVGIMPAGPREYIAGNSSSRLYYNDLGICKYNVHFFG